MTLDEAPSLHHPRVEAARAAISAVVENRWDEKETLRNLHGDYSNVWFGVISILSLVESGRWAEQPFWEQLDQNLPPYPMDYFKKKNKGAPHVQPDSRAQQVMEQFIPLIDELRAAIQSRDLNRLKAAFVPLNRLRDSIFPDQ